MERLTWRSSVDGYKDVALKDGVSTGDAICQLADYEDTGLGPQEITTEPYGCVFYCNRKCNLDGDWCCEGPGCQQEINAETAKHLLELAQAEKDGRLVVLPVKIGDKIYRLFDGEIQNLLVSNVIYKEIGGDACRILVECIPFHRCYWREDFGKTVFLTREGAEAALKKEGD